MRRKKVTYKKVDVDYDNGKFTVVEPGAERVEHPCLTDFDADNIDPDLIGTGLDDVASVLGFDDEHLVHARDPYEDPPLLHSNSGLINLAIRMRA